MALFGSARDYSLITKFNRELVYKLVDTEVGYYKFVLDQSRVNLYGEGISKVYYQPVRTPIYISRSPNDAVQTDAGIDAMVAIEFYILRDTMLTLNIVPEIGDIINWDDKYYEIDNTTENQYFAGKNPDTWIKGNNFGGSLSFVCNAHQIRETQLQLLDLNYGTNSQDYDLPLNI
jgi:hypothetical protein